MPHLRSPQLLDRGRCGLLVVDYQEKLCPRINSQELIERQIVRLVEVARLLEVPVAATVQYPRGLGPLVPSLRGAMGAAEEKLDFSAAVCRETLDRWLGQGRDQIVVVGIEAHVCVQQTVLDLIAEGWHPFVVIDAVGSRNELDRLVAIERMRDNGATVTTAEAAMFEWLGTADHPAFKAVSAIVKQGTAYPDAAPG
jgi:nicotinamidase-related amidase